MIKWMNWSSNNQSILSSESGVQMWSSLRESVVFRINDQFNTRESSTKAFVEYWLLFSDRSTHLWLQGCGNEKNGGKKKKKVSLFFGLRYRFTWPEVRLAGRTLRRAWMDQTARASPVFTADNCVNLHSNCLFDTPWRHRATFSSGAFRYRGKYEVFTSRTLLNFWRFNLGDRYDFFKKIYIYFQS